jgi:hypothetical protein
MGIGNNLPQLLLYGIRINDFRRGVGAFVYKFSYVITQCSFVQLVVV